MDSPPGKPAKYLLEAIQSNDPAEKNYHIRQALQLLSTANTTAAEASKQGDTERV